MLAKRWQDAGKGLARAKMNFVQFYANHDKRCSILYNFSVRQICLTHGEVELCVVSTTVRHVTPKREL